MRKILVRAPNWIGDQVLAYAFFRKLRELNPTARIEVTCTPWVAGLQFQGLVDAVHTLAIRRAARLPQKLADQERAAGALRDLGPWDEGYLLPPSLSSAWVFFRAGVRRRVGYATDARGWLLHEAREGSRLEREHRSISFLRLIPGAEADAAAIDDVFRERFSPAKHWPFPEAWEARLEPDATAEQRARVRRLEESVKEFWAIAPGSMAESRRWPIERWVAIARAITRETGWPCVIFGGKGEREVAAAIVAELGAEAVVDTTGSLKLGGLWRTMGRARGFVANESGLAHLASLLGLPGVVIPGAADPKATATFSSFLGAGKAFGPTPAALAPVRVMNPFSTRDGGRPETLHCWPCVRNRCPITGDAKNRCLTLVEARNVASTFLDLVR